MSRSAKEVAVKAKLLLEHTRIRADYGRLVSVVVCALCGNGLGSQMHELLVERDDAGSNDELMARILVEPENLTILCPHCNMVNCKTKHARAELTRQQVAKWGYEHLLDWVNGLPASAEQLNQLRLRLLAACIELNGEDRCQSSS